MQNRQTTGLLAVVLLLATWAAWQVYAGWGLVTLDVRDAPISRVLASISRQGGIEIASNLPPHTPVTMKVRRVPPVEALDILAVRTEAAWRLAYLGAPDRGSIQVALENFRRGAETAGWTSYGGGGFTLVAPQSGAALDLRRAVWSPQGTGELSAMLEEAADETGLFLAAPSDWNPDTKAPAAGLAARSIPALFRQAGGTSREVFLLRAQPNREDAPGGEAWGGGRWIGQRAESRAGGGGWMAALANPERLGRRLEAQIALLPADEQPSAREDFAALRKFWEEVRELPEPQRLARAMEFFRSPEMQERMEQRRMARENKMTPRQLLERSQRYWDRKASAKYGRSGS